VTLVNNNGLSTTLGGAFTLPGTVNFTVADNAAGDDLILSGPLSNSPGSNGVVAKFGPGTLALIGSNSYTGVTVIAEGVVRVNNDGNLGASTAPVYVYGGATLAISSTFSTSRQIQFAGFSVGTIDTGVSSLTLGGLVTGEGPVNKIGSGNLSI